jgi:hypothetical protein
MILETKRVCKSSLWENEDDLVEEHERMEQKRRDNSGRRRSSLTPPVKLPLAVDDDVEFDSDSSAECEDLFMGVWTPQLALKRRQARELSRTSA